MAYIFRAEQYARNSMYNRHTDNVALLRIILYHDLISKGLENASVC